MVSYLLRRIFLMIPVLIGLSLLTFTISHLIPGDPVMLVAGPQATKAEIQALAQEFGVDQPLPVQYVRYVSGLLRGDLGRSLLTRRQVSDDLRLFFPATIELVLAAMFFAILLGIPFGIASAVARDRWPDSVHRYPRHAFSWRSFCKLSLASSLASCHLARAFQRSRPHLPVSPAFSRLIRSWHAIGMRWAWRGSTCFCPRSRYRFRHWRRSRA